MKYIKVTVYLAWTLILSVSSLVGQNGIEGSQKCSVDLLKLYDSCQKRGYQQIEMIAYELGLIYEASKEGLLVEIVNRDSKISVPESYYQALGLQPNGQWRNRLSGWLSIEDFQNVFDGLQKGHFLEASLPIESNNQGQGLQNSQSYIDAGKNGTGIKIAIIDSGFNMLQNAQNAGAAPQNTINKDHVGSGLTAGSRHGTACLEVAFDNAPGSTFYLHKVGNATHWGLAVEQAIEDEVDIISLSLGPHNTGWDDNTGGFNEAVTMAANNGILVFSSAGNEAQKHWQGAFSDNDNDNNQNWAGTDERNTISVPGCSGSCTTDTTITVWLQWDSAEGNDHYDLLLMVGNTLIDISNNSNNFEKVFWRNNTSATAQVDVIVQANTANPPDFEIFSHPRSLQYQVAASSIECPANNTHPNVISVGAVHRNNYDTIPGSIVIEGYSSHGPTNSGAQAPDLCAPTSCTTVAYSGNFGGTSCSAPNAAGAAATFWSAHPQYSASGIRQIIQRKALLFSDWGDNGTDMIYGRGGLFLKDYLANSIYVYEFSGNTNGTDEVPYASIQQTNQYAPAGKNAFFLGHTYAAPPAGTVIQKPMIYRSVADATNIQ